jgi:hypothetical protein
LQVVVCQSNSGGLDRGANEAESLIGIRAEGGNSSDAHHDDQSEHHGVLDRGGAIFLLKEVDNFLAQTAHEKLLGG